jgi:hypothetical protein
VPPLQTSEGAALMTLMHAKTSPVQLGTSWLFPSAVRVLSPASYINLPTCCLPLQLRHNCHTQTGSYLSFVSVYTAPHYQFTHYCPKEKQHLSVCLMSSLIALHLFGQFQLRLVQTRDNKGNTQTSTKWLKTI